MSKQLLHNPPPLPWETPRSVAPVHDPNAIVKLKVNPKAKPTRKRIASENSDAKPKRKPSPKFASRKERDAYYREKHFGVAIDKLADQKSAAKSKQTEQLEIELPAAFLPVLKFASGAYGFTTGLIRIVWHLFALITLSLIAAILMGIAIA